MVHCWVNPKVNSCVGCCVEGSHLVALSTEAIRAVSQKDWALLVARGINWFPSNEDKWKGSIDVWWVVRILP